MQHLIKKGTGINEGKWGQGLDTSKPIICPTSLVLFWVLICLLLQFFFSPCMKYDLWQRFITYQYHVWSIKRGSLSYFEFEIFNQGRTQNGLDWITFLANIPVVRGQRATRPGQPGYITIHVCQEIWSISTKRGIWG